MRRLTERINGVVVYTRGKYTNTTAGEMTSDDVRNVLSKLCEYEDKEHMTNADRIRNMSDEELAEFFDKMLNQDREDWESIGCFDCIYYKTHHQDKSRPDYACKDCEFKDGLLGWLQTEVKEGGADECN